MLQFLQGNCLDILPTLPEKSVHCVITSPPYFGLRDYGVDSQIGLEPTPAEYVANLVQVFAECWRVLRDDGTLWLNLGDSYNGQNPNRSGSNGYNDGRTNRDKRYSSGGIEGLKPKDLIGIPWRVAFALQDFGWYLRSDIIWHKPNPMPESVTDRPTKSHEYVFLLSKSQRYYYDAEAIKEDAKTEPHAPGNTASYHDELSKNTRVDRMNKIWGDSGKVNKRTVWTVPTSPYKGAHFATFPPELIKPMILAGCPVGGTVLDPFSGSGTTAAEAIALGRNAIGIELNPEYIELAKVRAAQPGFMV